MIDEAKLQAAVGAPVDGVAGRVTWSFLFAKMGAKVDRSGELGLAAAVHFPAYGVTDNALRLAHFLAQLAHESGSFRYMEEIASGAAYEGRADLGNTEPGDGVRYKGRGPIQLTGRANSRRFGRRIGIDLERHPELAAIPSIGLHIALEYWNLHKLNVLADQDDLRRITRTINGGYNGLADREAHLRKIKGWLL